MGIEIPCSTLFHDLCEIEAYIVCFRNSILISTASKLRTSMECGILHFKHAPYQHFPSFWVKEMSDFTKEISHLPGEPGGGSLFRVSSHRGYLADLNHSNSS